MSVKNRYASNFRKVSPFSPSSRLVVDSKVMVRKQQDAVRTRVTENKGIDVVANISQQKPKKSSGKTNSSTLISEQLDTKNESSSAISVKRERVKTPYKSTPKKFVETNVHTQVSNISGKEIRTPAFVTVKTNGTISYGKQEKHNTKIIRRHSETQYDTFPESKETERFPVKNLTHSSGQESKADKHNTTDLKVPKEKTRRHSDSQCEAGNMNGLSYDENPQQRLKHESPKSSSEDLIFRPKSARPSSRWERRLGEEAVDVQVQAPETNYSRPKSARPESRIMRHIEVVDGYDFGRQATPPPRPITSRGRRQTDGFADNNGSSQIGMHINPVMKHTGSGNKTKFTNIESNGQSIAYDKSIHGYDPVSFRHEQIKVMNAKDVLDLNSGIDEIDLDIDPVVYFLQDDDIMNSNTYKPSLSKDAINIIGKASFEAEQKPPISCHSNRVNKHRHLSDEIDNLRRNERSDSKNTITGIDRSLHQIELFKDLGDKNQKPKTTFRPHAYSENSENSLWHNSGICDSVSDKMIAKYSAVPPSSRKDMRNRAIKSERAYKPFINQTDIPLRKPRKLKPITGRFLKE